MISMGGGKPIFITSKRGNQLILLSGYKYFVKASHSVGRMTKRRWNCSTHHAKGCRALLHTANDTILKINDRHNHSPVYRF
ncbi:unnamed protein product, partial [Iphiclides podalirius]